MKQEKTMVTCGSYPGKNSSDQETNENGLPYNHAFTVMGSLTVEDDSGAEHRLVKMRNPWGSNNEKYRGKWSD